MSDDVHDSIGDSRRHSLSERTKRQIEDAGGTYVQPLTQRQRDARAEIEDEAAWALDPRSRLPWRRSPAGPSRSHRSA